ncbi:NADH:flavin oxidoreductase [Oenococcus oeni]|uniref:NADH:flavin oxidoreductase, Old Yellow Enzyme family n=1 Tax=Oenococcus oeni (strain ATCC BAA-331 / PSU-1) TaxID=203123 RepID=Q04F21_OENOB|nr:NADH:flavin oxidoreductase [Oenococcus oeni]ABJ56951.1 NADH:flavin oxidoreductase, Old Yellow Enzyme family [Oenococcus oeni PSU-1]OIK68231.1 NADH:flavin oxidoreductase [Oenococcus oeni]OIL14711.1 NADH:flavin oxidoreductase [Oenococcus oeni]OIL28860.1 NADH:flavin oxidoreductase [Oenococcus oeni]OIL81368.1 NADH:flavin oxidoreductase [Oenococcus oeni]
MKTLQDSIIFRHGAKIKGRIVQPPMLTNSGNDGYVTQDALDYYAARSQSAGMIIVEYTTVSENGGPSRSWARDREQLTIYDDKFKPGMAKLATVIKKMGIKLYYNWSIPVEKLIISLNWVSRFMHQVR